MNHRWAVIDDGGTIAEGDEEFARSEFEAYVEHFEGDLRLVEIHEVRR